MIRTGLKTSWSRWVGYHWTVLNYCWMTEWGQNEDDLSSKFLAKDHGALVLKNSWIRMVTSMLSTKCVGENYNMLVTVLAILVSNIEFQSPTSTNRHQLYLANITMSPTSLSLRGLRRAISNIYRTFKLHSSYLIPGSFQDCCLLCHTVKSEIKNRYFEITFGLIPK